MVEVEPVIDAPAATVTLGTQRLLLIADYHAGIELGFRYRDGLHIPSRAEGRRDSLLRLVADTDADELIIIGDAMHSIGAPAHAEREELEQLSDALPSDVDLSVVKGNHDGDIEDWFDVATVYDAPGVVRDGLALSHGHTWPPREALDADVLVIGHEHPRVRLEDTVGGSDVHRVWLRGRLDTELIATHHGIADPDTPTDLVVMPAFNELSGGTWVNVEGEQFLVPYLPEGVHDTRVYLLDGTLLGTTLVA